MKEKFKIELLSFKKFEYNNETKEIIIKFELKKDNDVPYILDEMYG